jgi:recombination protein RecR
MYPKDFLKLIHFLKKLSGVGSKTAERYAFELINWKDADIEDLSSLFKDLKKNIIHCQTCGCMIANETCSFCDPKLRDIKKICIVSSFKEVFMLENTNTYKGLYHIIDTLSPIDGKEINNENMEKLKKRIAVHNVQELIIAFDSTIEGDITALYLKDQMQKYKLKISRLAFGLPIGASLDYIDSTTLSQAFIGRQAY